MITKEQAAEALEFIKDTAKENNNVRPISAWNTLEKYIETDKSEQFINDCLRTKSDQFHSELVGQTEFREELTNAISALQWLDKFKKALFYARKFQQYEGSINLSQVENKLDKDIIHCILGKATEAGELLELLYDGLFEGKEFDKINFIEELGDGQWYDAIGANAVGLTFEEIQAKVIAKLKTRFPEKYSDQAANNRDLDAERKTLET